MKFYIQKSHLWYINRPPMSRDQADRPNFLLLGVIVGGRLGYVFLQLGLFVNNPIEIIKVFGMVECLSTEDRWCLVCCSTTAG